MFFSLLEGEPGFNCPSRPLGSEEPNDPIMGAAVTVQRVITHGDTASRAAAQRWSRGMPSANSSASAPTMEARRWPRFGSPATLPLK